LKALQALPVGLTGLCELIANVVSVYVVDVPELLYVLPWASTAHLYYYRPINDGVWQVPDSGQRYRSKNRELSNLMVAT
jgi:hypothetical protein